VGTGALVEGQAVGAGFTALVSLGGVTPIGCQRSTDLRAPAPLPALPLPFPGLLDDGGP
jgi:hypothetical protein